MNRNKGNTVVWVVITIVIALVVMLLFSAPKSASSTVPCLVPGLPLVQHIHPRLRVVVDDKEQVIPANVGIGACERAVHMHDTSGEIHIEAQDSREYTLGDFFDVWGEQIMKEGYAAEMTVDGTPSQELGNLKLKDKQEIVVKYKKV